MGQNVKHSAEAGVFRCPTDRGYPRRA